MGEHLPRTPPGPPAGGVIPAQRGINSLAVVSIAAAVASYLIPHPFIGALVAIVTGHMARSENRKTGQGGSGLALAGLLLGYLHLLLTLLLIIFFFGALVTLLGIIGYAVTHGGSVPQPTPSSGQAA
jgi:hypothetical protein